MEYTVEMEETDRGKQSHSDNKSGDSGWRVSSTDLVPTGADIVGPKGLEPPPPNICSPGLMQYVSPPQ